MWQRFTERARTLVFRAQEEAMRFGEGYVSTEHLLLGLLKEPDSTGSRTLIAIGISLEDLRHRIEVQLPKPVPRAPSDMTLTPRAKQVIDFAYDEARGLNQNYIGTEHLLLGLVRECDGLSGRVLSAVGVELHACRDAVLSIQAQESRPQAPPPPPPQRRDAVQTLRLLMDILLYDSAGQRLVKAAGVTDVDIDKLPPAVLSGGSDSKPLLPIDDVFRFAHEEAVSLGSKTLTSAHFVIALVANDERIASAFQGVGVTLEYLRETMRGLDTEGS